MFILTHHSDALTPCVTALYGLPCNEQTGSNQMSKFFLVAFVLLQYAASAAAGNEALEVLYLSDNSNLFHDYKKQSENLIEELEKNINATVYKVGNDKKQLVSLLETEDFAVGYDLIIYNACLSENTKKIWQDNLISQTKKNAVPMIILHCGLQNFKPNNLGPYIAGINPLRNKEPWTKSSVNKYITDWWKFTGMATTVHSPIKSFKVKKVTEHPITANIADDWQPPADELYFEIKRSAEAQALLSSEDGAQMVAWLHPAGESQIFATTLGHRLKTFKDKTYLEMISRAALFLTGRMDDNGFIEAQNTGNKYFYNYSKAVLCKPSAIVEASNTEEVSALIQKYTASQTPLKVVSISNPGSYSDVICAKQGGVIINVAEMNRVVSVNKQALSVKVQPGVTLDKLGKHLEKYDLVFPTTADFSGITVAGGMATGAHHSSLTRGAGVHDYVKSITLVDSRGSVRTLKGDHRPKKQLFT